MWNMKANYGKYDMGQKSNCPEKLKLEQNWKIKVRIRLQRKIKIMRTN